MMYLPIYRHVCQSHFSIFGKKQKEKIIRFWYAVCWGLRLSKYRAIHSATVVSFPQFTRVHNFSFGQKSKSYGIPNCTP